MPIPKYESPLELLVQLTKKEEKVDFPIAQKWRIIPASILLACSFMLKTNVLLIGYDIIEPFPIPL